MSDRRPVVSEADVINILSEHYDLRALRMEELVSFDSRNFAVEVVPLSDENDGEERELSVQKCMANNMIQSDSTSTSSASRVQYLVLKVLNGQLCTEEKLPTTRQQIVSSQLLRQQGFLCPEIIYTNKRVLFSPVNNGSQAVLMRRLAGQALGLDKSRLTAAVLFELGVLLACLHTTLEGFDDRHLETDASNPWALENIHLLPQYLPCIESEAERELLSYIIAKFQVIRDNSLPSMKKGVIHGDFHDHNLIVDWAATAVTAAAAETALSPPTTHRPEGTPPPTSHRPEGTPPPTTHRPEGTPLPTTHRPEGTPPPTTHRPEGTPPPTTHRPEGTPPPTTHRPEGTPPPTTHRPEGTPPPTTHRPEGTPLPTTHRPEGTPPPTTHRPEGTPLPTTHRPEGTPPPTTHRPEGTPPPTTHRPEGTPPPTTHRPEGTPPPTTHRPEGTPPPTTHRPEGTPLPTTHRPEGTPPPTTHRPEGTPLPTTHRPEGTPPPTTHRPEGTPPPTTHRPEGTPPPTVLTDPWRRAILHKYGVIDFEEMSLSYPALELARLIADAMLGCDLVDLADVGGHVIAGYVSVGGGGGGGGGEWEQWWRCLYPCARACLAQYIVLGTYEYNEQGMGRDGGGGNQYCLLGCAGAREVLQRLSGIDEKEIYAAWSTVLAKSYDLDNISILP